MFVFCKLKVYGVEKIPQGRALICCNHTSLMDPLYLAVAMYGKRRITTKYMAKKEITRIPLIPTLLKNYLIFIDRGKSDLKAIKDTIEIVRNGGKVVIFPEGTRVSSGENIQGKSGVSMISIKSETPLVPVYITGGKKPLWRFPKVDIVFGDAYMPERRPRTPVSVAYREIADDLMQRIENLSLTLASEG